MKNTTLKENLGSCGCAVRPDAEHEIIPFNKVVDSFHRYITKVTLALFRMGDSLPKKKREDHAALINTVAETGAETVNFLRGYNSSKLKSAPRIRVTLPPKYMPEPTTIAEATERITGQIPFTVKKENLAVCSRCKTEFGPVSPEPKAIMVCPQCDLHFRRPKEYFADANILNLPGGCFVAEPPPKKSVTAISITLRNPDDVESRAGFKDVDVGQYYWVVYRGTVMQVRVVGRPTSKTYTNHDSMEVTLMSSRFTGSMPAGTSLILHDLSAFYFNDEVVANAFWSREVAQNT